MATRLSVGGQRYIQDLTSEDARLRGVDAAEILLVGPQQHEQVDGDAERSRQRLGHRERGLPPPRLDQGDVALI
jgi:hypothetical protein